MMKADYKTVLIWAALSGMASVMMGAFGAHALKLRLEEWALTVFHTSVEYQFYHTFALLAVAILMLINKGVSLRLLTLSAISFLLGIFLFCGSLYALSLSELLTGTKLGWLGIITPFGGTLFIIGWVLLALSPSKQTH